MNGKNAAQIYSTSWSEVPLTKSLHWLDQRGPQQVHPASRFKVGNPATASGLKSKIVAPHGGLGTNGVVYKKDTKQQLILYTKGSEPSIFRFRVSASGKAKPSCWDNVSGWKMPATASCLHQRSERLQEFFKN